MYSFYSSIAGARQALPRRMRTLIVDDEPQSRSCLERMCQQQADVQVIGQAESGSQAIASIRERRPDLVLLDLELADMSGFDVLRSIESLARPLAIMVTEFPQHAARAFASGAIDYLTKPVVEARFSAAIERARRHCGAGRLDARLRDHVVAGVLAAFAEYQGAPGPQGGQVPRLVGEKGRRIHFIDVDDVDYIESDGNYVVIHAGDQRYLSRNTLKRICATVESCGFVRIARSLLLNLRRVVFAERAAVGGFVFTMPGGRRLSSSRAYRKTIVKAMRFGHGASGANEAIAARHASRTAS